MIHIIYCIDSYIVYIDDPMIYLSFLFHPTPPWMAAHLSLLPTAAAMLKPCNDLKPGRECVTKLASCNVPSKDLNQWTPWNHCNLIVWSVWSVCNVSNVSNVHVSGIVIVHVLFCCCHEWMDGSTVEPNCFEPTKMATGLWGFLGFCDASLYNGRMKNCKFCFQIVIPIPN